MRKLLQKFLDLNIKYKMLLSMIGIILVTSFSIISVGQYFFSNLIIKELNDQISYTVNVVTSSLNDEISSIQSSVSNFALEENIHYILTDIQKNNSDEFPYNYNKIQPILSNFLESNDLIDTIILLGKNGEFYSESKIGLSYAFDDAYIWEDVKSNNIQWVPMRFTPITRSKNLVVPIVYPMTLTDLGHVSFFVPDSNQLIANFYVLLDVNKLNFYLSKLNKSSKSTLVLLDSTGTPLNISLAHPFYSFLINQDLQNTIHSNEALISEKVTYNDEHYLISTSSLNYSGLKIVNITSESTILEHKNLIKQFSYTIFIIALMMSAFLSFFISQSITKPLNHLTSFINQFNLKNKDQNEFSLPKPRIKAPYFNDEVGVLNKTFLHMLETIKSQINTIKKQEREKTDIEIEILTHQINPHFLYNTLDCIDWEILSGNNEGASQMIESLGAYLRIGLSGGRNTIPIREEILRTEEYINIMNYRMNSNIALDYHIDSDIEDLEIMKLITQPLVENCFKHAFNEETLLQISKPRIFISFKRENSFIHFKITDNGQGIDINKAEKILSTPRAHEKNHVGLRNIYARLNAYYNNTTIISFESKPLVENTINIRFQYTH